MSGAGPVGRVLLGCLSLTHTHSTDTTVLRTTSPCWGQNRVIGESFGFASQPAREAKPDDQGVFRFCLLAGAKRQCRKISQHSHGAMEYPRGRRTFGRVLLGSLSLTHTHTHSTDTTVLRTTSPCWGQNRVIGESSGFASQPARGIATSEVENFSS